MCTRNLDRDLLHRPRLIEDGAVLLKKGLGMIRLASVWLLGVFAFLPGMGRGSVLYTYE